MNWFLSSGSAGNWIPSPGLGIQIPVSAFPATYHLIPSQMPSSQRCSLPSPSFLPITQHCAFSSYGILCNRHFCITDRQQSTASALIRYLWNLISFDNWNSFWNLSLRSLTHQIFINQGLFQKLGIRQWTKFKSLPTWNFSSRRGRQAI